MVIFSITIKLISEISCLVQLKWTASSHVFSVRKHRTTCDCKTVVVEPTYCKLHLLHEAKQKTFLEERDKPWLILYIQKLLHYKNIYVLGYLRDRNAAAHSVDGNS